MSLKDVTVELDALTIFVGWNGSGKSAIFKALVLLSKLLNGSPLRGPKGPLSLEPGVTLDHLVWNGDSGLPISFQVWLSDAGGDPDYELELRKRAEGWSVTSERIVFGGSSIIVDEDNAFEHPSEKGVRTYAVPLRATLRYLVNPLTSDATARPAIEPILMFASKFGQAWRYRPSATDIAAFVSRPKERGRIVHVVKMGGAWPLSYRICTTALQTGSSSS